MDSTEGYVDFVACELSGHLQITLFSFIIPQEQRKAHKPCHLLSLTFYFDFNPCE